MANNETVRTYGAAAGVGLVAAIAFGGIYFEKYDNGAVTSLESCANTLNDPHMSGQDFAKACGQYFVDKSVVSPADTPENRTVSVVIPKNLTQVDAFKNEELPAAQKADAEAKDQQLIPAVIFGGIVGSAAMLTTLSIGTWRRRRREDGQGEFIGTIPAAVSKAKSPRQTATKV